MANTKVDSELTTLDAVKEYLGFSPEDESENGRLSALVAMASARISSYCSRKFARDTHVEIRSGNGTPFLYLRHWPITTPLASVTVDAEAGGIWWDQGGVFNAGTKLQERDGATGNGDYVVRADEEGQGCVEMYASAGRNLSGRGEAVWPRGIQNVRAVYEAGYDEIPGDVAMAATRVAAWYYQRAKRGLDAALSVSMQAGGGSLTVADHKLPPDVREMLVGWRAARVV